MAGQNYCVVGGCLLSLSLCRRVFHDLLKVRPCSLFILCGCFSSSIASLMSRSMHPVLAERSLVYCSLMMWSWLMFSVNSKLNSWRFYAKKFFWRSMSFRLVQNFYVVQCRIPLQISLSASNISVQIDTMTTTLHLRSCKNSSCTFHFSRQVWTWCHWAALIFMKIGRGKGKLFRRAQLKWAHSCVSDCVRSISSACSSG